MKKHQTITLTVLLLLLIAIVNACKKTENQISTPTPFVFITPNGFPPPESITFQNNPITLQGIELGRKLFYDGRLSKDGNFPCSSCHQQFSGFATYDHSLSHGFNNQFTTRNAPGLFNLAWQKSFHWDGGINHLEVQPLAPITAPNEMGITLDSALMILKADSAYYRMFNNAFGNPSITSQRMLKALAQFTGSLITSNSKYDRVMNGLDTFSNFEKKGYVHFKNNCASCHKEPLFTDNSFRNNGMPLNRFNDIGRQRITGLSSDSLKFKVPSLRNIQLTFPYMHDGSIFSVPQVIDHYIAKTNAPQIGLDSVLRKPIVLNKLQKNELIYFLYTLTDTVFTKNKRFAPDGPVYFKH